LRKISTYKFSDEPDYRSLIEILKDLGSIDHIIPEIKKKLLNKLVMLKDGIFKQAKSIAIEEVNAQAMQQRRLRLK
jgi:hypothetical protein